jgi:hypothetical protein
MKKSDILKKAYDDKRNRKRLMDEFNHCTNRYEFVLNHPALFSSNFSGNDVSSSTNSNNSNTNSNSNSNFQNVSYDFVSNYNGITYTSSSNNLSALTSSATTANNNLFKIVASSYIKTNEKTNLLLSYKLKNKSANLQCVVGLTSMGTVIGDYAMAASGTYKNYKPGLYAFFYNGKVSLFILDMPTVNDTESIVVASIEQTYAIVDDTMIHFHINYTLEGNMTMNLMVTSGITIIQKLYHARFNRSKFYQGILMNYNISLGVLDDSLDVNTVSIELVPTPTVVLNDFLSVGSTFYDYYSFNKGLNSFNTIASLTATDPDGANGTTIFKSSNFSNYNHDTILSFKFVGHNSEVNTWGANIAWTVSEVTSPSGFPVFNQNNPGLYSVLYAVAVGEKRWGYNYILDKVDGTGSTIQGTNINNINYSDSTYGVHFFYNNGYDIARICVTVNDTPINKLQYIVPNNSILKSGFRQGNFYVGVGIKDTVIAGAYVTLNMYQTPESIVSLFRLNLNNPSSWIS